MAYVFSKLDGLLNRKSDALLNPNAAQGAPGEGNAGSQAALQTSGSAGAISRGGASTNLAEQGQSAQDFTRSGFKAANAIVDANKNADADLLTNTGTELGAATRKLQGEADAYKTSTAYKPQASDADLASAGTDEGAFTRLNSLLHSAKAPVAAFKTETPGSEQFGKTIQGLQSGAGQAAALGEQFGATGDYGSRAREIDANLLGQSSGFKDRLKNLSAAAGSFDSQRRAAEGLTASQQGAYDTARDAELGSVRSRLGEQASGIQSDIGRRLTEAQKSRAVEAESARVRAQEAAAAQVKAQIEAARAQYAEQRREAIRARQGELGRLNPDNYDIPNIEGMLQDPADEAAFVQSLEQENLNPSVLGSNISVENPEMGLENVTTADEAGRFSRLMALLDKGDRLATPAGAVGGVTSRFDADRSQANVTAGRDNALSALQGRLAGIKGTLHPNTPQIPKTLPPLPGEQGVVNSVNNKIKEIVNAPLDPLNKGVARAKEAVSIATNGNNGATGGDIDTSPGDGSGGSRNDGTGKKPPLIETDPKTGETKINVPDAPTPSAVVQQATKKLINPDSEAAYVADTLQENVGQFNPGGKGNGGGTPNDNYGVNLGSGGGAGIGNITSSSMGGGGGGK